MSTISEKLTQLNTIKGDIKAAINNKGGEVGNDFSTYATAINNLSTGSGETYENPDFYELKTSNGTNFDSLFRGYNGPDIDVSAWDASKVTSAQYCFADCKKSMDISNWDLSSLTNAQRMFDSFTNNNKYIDLSVLDFSNISNAHEMFYYSNTDYLDVRNINLTGATSYYNLFASCYGTELDLSAWDISGVTDIYSMCSSSNFKKVNLSGWNTVNVTSMRYAFSYCYNLETLLIPDWDMTNVKSTSSIMSSSSKLKYIDLSRSNDLTITKIAPMLPTKTQSAYGEILVPADTSQDVINAVTAKYWKPIGPKIDLTSTELVLELDEIEPGKTTKVWTGNSDPWYGDDRPETIEFISSDESLATINGREVISTGIEGTVEITARRRDTQEVISTAPVTLTVSETDNNPNLIKIRTNGKESSTGDLIVINNNYVKTSEFTKDAAGIYSYNHSEQIFQIRFIYTTEVIKLNFNESNITSMYQMFAGYEGKTLDLSDWDTSNVTNTNSLFYSCNNLIDIIGELDMSNVVDSQYMFYGNNNIKTVYLKNIYKNCTMTNNSKWSIDLRTTKVKDECLLYIINELPDLYAKGLTNTSNIIFTLPPTNTLTAEQVQPAIDKGWIVANVNY